MVCGGVLEYGRTAETLTCTYCGTVASGHIRCPAGHYVCDRCHDRDALETVTALCRTTTLTDPLAIAELAMAAPGLPMLGCGHAVIAGIALAAALRNHGLAAFAGDETLREIRQRIENQAHGGYCGLTGVCGVVAAVGACVSVLTGATCGTDREQRLTMTAVTRAARAITDLTGPSCCKAYVRAGLAVARDFLAAECGVTLGAGAAPVCRDVDRHPHGCRRERCPYYPDPRSGANGGGGER